MSNKSNYYLVIYKPCNIYHAKLLKPKDIQGLILSYLCDISCDELSKHIQKDIFDFKSGGKNPVQYIKENMYIVYANNEKYAIKLVKVAQHG